MNGPLKMYRTHQIIRHDLKVPLPDCMYKIKNIHATSDETGPLLDDHVSSAKKSVNISEQVKQFLKNLQNEPEMTALVERQEKILKQLDELRQQMISLKSDLSVRENSIPLSKILQAPFAAPCNSIPEMPNVIINASPSHPPYSLIVVQKLWSKLVQLNITTHKHSTVSSLPEKAAVLSQSLENSKTGNVGKTSVDVRLIWKDVGPNTELIISQMPIIGEVNILRYFARMNPHCLSYENLENVNEIDSILDVCYLIVRAKTKSERQNLLQYLNKQLGKSEFLCGRNKFSIADVAASSAIKQVALNEINQNMSKWLQRCDEILK